MQVAAHEARMRAPDKQGNATRLHYQGIANRVALVHGEESPQYKKALQNLEGPEIPEQLAYLWLWFLELDRTRTHGMNGPDPITYPMIDAWARLTQRTPDAIEVDALLLLDVVSRHPDALKAEDDNA